MPYERTLAAFRRGDNAETARLAKSDLDEATAAGDIPGQVDALCMLSRVALRDGRLDEVDSLAGQALQVAAASADPKLRRMPIHMHAVAARMSGRIDEGRALYMRSIDLNDELGEARMAAVEHRNLAYLELRAGDADRALALIAECRDRLRGVDSSSLTAYLVFDEATEAAIRGDDAAAAGKLAEAERIFAEQGVVPDPDDALEIAELKQRLSGGG